LRRLLRGIVVLVCIALICAVVFVCLARAQEPAQLPSQPPVQGTPAQTQAPTPPATYQITGTVKAGKTPLPGVTVTASNTLTGKKFSVATAMDGSFILKDLPRGRYVVKVEFMGFATTTQDVVLNPDNPAGKVEPELVLASRQQEEQAANGANIAAAATRGFQSLAVEGNASSLTDLANGNTGGSNVSASDLSSLPNSGAGADLSTESFAVAGQQGRSQDFGMGSEEDLQQRVQEFRDRAQQMGGNAFGQVLSQGGGFGGGPGGPGGFGGGPIMIRSVGGRRGFNLNQPHGFIYVQDDNAALDARSYSLSGVPAAKPDYNTVHFGGLFGSPLKIPGLFDWSKSTFITAGWNATRGSTPYDSFATVPTAAERGGDFSGLTSITGAPITIYNPQTGQPFANNTIDPSLISSQATALLNYVPLPNLPGTTQNYHYITSATSDTDAVSFRLIHNFVPNSGGPMGGFGPGGGGGGRGGGGGGRRNQPRNNLNIGFNLSRTKAETIGAFPSLAGKTNSQGWNGTAGWVYGKGKATNTLRFTYNHNRASTTNLYSGVLDAAGNAGITQISPDPFNWGLPGIDLTSFTGLSSPIPSRVLNQTYTITDQIFWNHAKHNWRFGGDYRRILEGTRSARNAEGTFVFTGFATAGYEPGTTPSTATELPNTGLDFADFLLGLPQQTTLQSGTNAYEFRANSLDAYAQDDWRILPNLSLNLGMRYEYIGPYTETQSQIANLDVNFSPSAVTAFQVLPGQAGPYSGVFPESLVRPDRHDFAPRVGLAWRLDRKTVIRSGYGINYNLAQYGTFISNFAFQPPFAIAATNALTADEIGALTLHAGFPGNSSSQVTNNYALDPNYKLGYVQIWNLDIQRQLPWNTQLNVGYSGSKGTRLDTQRALVPSCESVSCESSPNEALAPFIYESSEGSSTFNSATVRLRKRMSQGIGVSLQYVFSKSLDDATSIGAEGGMVVAQNPFDIRAERSLSSFDQTHNVTGTWMYDLPFGDGKRFLTKGALSHVMDGWQWSGSFTIASGLYLTPNVLGQETDIARGVSGSVRANVVAGQAISLANPTTKEWFNTGAFCITGSATCAGPTIYGDAGRDIIEGPSQYIFNMAMSKSITIKETRVLELRLQAANIFNTPYFSSINTTVNSALFGQVTGVSSMRRLTMVARFRF
jgi:trimeric autotransporter adhesin